jgi:hypothetical protein
VYPDCGKWAIRVLISQEVIGIGGLAGERANTPYSLSGQKVAFGLLWIRTHNSSYGIPQMAVFCFYCVSLCMGVVLLPFEIPTLCLHGLRYHYVLIVGVAPMHAEDNKPYKVFTPTRDLWTMKPTISNNTMYTGCHPRINQWQLVWCQGIFPAKPMNYFQSKPTSLDCENFHRMNTSSKFHVLSLHMI